MKMQELQKTMPRPEDVAFLHMAIGQFLYHSNYGMFKNVSGEYPVNVSAPMQFLQMVHMQSVADLAVSRMFCDSVWEEVIRVIPEKGFRPSAFEDFYHAAWIVLQKLGILSVRYERENDESDDLFCYVEGTPHGEYVLRRVQTDTVLPPEQMMIVCSSIEGIIAAKFEAEQQSLIVVPPGTLVS